MSVFLQELRYAVRSLRKSPGFAGAAIGTLALGVAASAAVFSILHAVVLAPLPYRQPDRLVAAWEVMEDGRLWRPAPATFRSWREQARSFESLAAFGGATWTLSGEGGPVSLRGSRVTSNYFGVLGVVPIARPRLSARGRDRGSGSRRRPEPCALGLAFQRRPVGPGPAPRPRRPDVHGRRRHAAGAVSRLGPDDRQARLRPGRATVLRAREPRRHRSPGRPELRARSDRASPRRRFDGGRPTGDVGARPAPARGGLHEPCRRRASRAARRKRPRAQCGPPSGSSSAPWGSSSRSAARTSRASSSPARRPAGGSSRCAPRWARAAAGWRRRSCSSRCSSPRRPARWECSSRSGRSRSWWRSCPEKCPASRTSACIGACSSFPSPSPPRRASPRDSFRRSGPRERELRGVSRSSAGARPPRRPAAARSASSCSARPRSPSCSPRVRSS